MVDIDKPDKVRKDPFVELTDGGNDQASDVETTGIYKPARGTWVRGEQQVVLCLTSKPTCQSVL
jgi:hypothetical protein